MAILNYVVEMFDEKELEDINIISLPIMNVQYCKNIKNFLVKGNSLFITDSSKTSFFDDLQMLIKNFLKEYKISDLELDHRKINSVEDERGLLRQMGVTKRIIISYLK